MLAVFPPARVCVSQHVVQEDIVRQVAVPAVSQPSRRMVFMFMV
jgi:hypothetical protein